jgi:hypothetical protein
MAGLRARPFLFPPTFRLMKTPFALILAAVVCTLSACASSSVTVATGPSPSTSGISVDELRRDLFVFAADSFGGRETGTPYADKAALWLARRLSEIGVEPAGDSGYFHRVPMRRTVVTAGPIAIGPAGSARSLRMGDDIALLTTLGPGAPLPRDSVAADVVFAGYGIVDPSMQRDDYASVNVAGKVVVIAGLAPPGVSDSQRRAMENAQALFNRIGLALARQPAGIVLLLPDSIYRMAASQFTGVQIELDRGEAAPAPQQRVLPFVALGPLGGSPFLPSGWPSSASATLAPGTRFTASYRETKDVFNGYNVVGVVRGTDPHLRNTYVAYGAHYDHVGIGAPVNGDSIHNGADDDGSGSVTLLAVARLWKQAPPKRSGLFIWHIGEEKGLFGSEAFTNRPTVPLDSIVGQINADMIGRNAADSLYIVGPGAAPNGQSSVMGVVVDSVNGAGPRPFQFNREWDTTTHPERIYYRSDHYNYARKGIPIVFFTTGLHPQYHQVTDEAALIDYDKLSRVGDLMHRVGVALGNRPTRPKPTSVQ